MVSHIFWDHSQKLLHSRCIASSRSQTSVQLRCQFYGEKKIYKRIISSDEQWDKETKEPYKLSANATLRLRCMFYFYFIHSGLCVLAQDKNIHTHTHTPARALSRQFFIIILLHLLHFAHFRKCRKANQINNVKRHISHTFYCMLLYAVRVLLFSIFRILVIFSCQWHIKLIRFCCMS